MELMIGTDGADAVRCSRTRTLVI
uniref:Uncharacterized protein n=1 Tax=Arundo donax TaxID=35708 RepID=A0A0A8Y3Z2_ARUDO